MNSDLRVESDQKGELPFAYARVEHNGKFSQIYIAEKEKLYLSDYWKDGVCLAHGKTKSIDNLAKSLDYWLNNDVLTRELHTAFEFIEPDKISDAFDNGKEVEYSWSQMLYNGIEELKPFIHLAIKDEVVNKFFPYTSLYTLCFSRCTGYPYDSKDLPNVTPKLSSWTLPEMNKKDEVRKATTDEMVYVITKNKNEYLGEGNAVDTLKLVKDNLPNGMTLARKGISEK